MGYVTYGIYPYVISHMKNLLAIFLLNPIFAIGQQNTSELIITNDSDTAFYYQFMKEKVSTFDLTRIGCKEEEFVFRSWGPSSLLEITRTKDKIKGNIFYFVMEAGEKQNVFVKGYELSDNTSNLLHNYIISSKVIKLPSDKFIEDWSAGFDGITFTYETKRNDSISFKHYWTPSAQEGIPEAEIIIQFNKRIEELGDFDQYAKAFEVENPFSSYMYYGASYSIIKLDQDKKTKKSKRRKTRDNKTYE